jgi:NAD(P)-dependent dehydrogenase (short-subunit alcohol dehydrogenase family)
MPMAREESSSTSGQGAEHPAREHKTSVFRSDDYGLPEQEDDAKRRRKVQQHMIIEAGQVAVVTGAAQGLGRALAAGLVDRGLSVVLADVAKEPLHDTAEIFTASGADVLAVITDVSDPAAVTTLACRTLEHFGRVDLVVNNAGIATGSGGQPLWQTSPETWQRVLAVNVLGVVHGLHAFMPHLVTAGAGHVVNIASLAGLSTWPFGAAYCASKHAVVAISETLHRELELMGLRIGVTVACPGLVRTPLGERLIALVQADPAGAEHAPAPGRSAAEVRALLQRLMATLIEPEVAAERILTAVEADRLHALTHGDPDDDARRRVEVMLAALGDHR